MPASADLTLRDIETFRSRRFVRVQTELKTIARDVDAVLELVLPKPRGSHRRVHEAMRYAVFAGGKRLRPLLVLSSANLFGAEAHRALRVAAAIEALHTYSLVHDDLPCMDDDDFRRGRPTTHIAFDEATAVLAGDALLTLAFEILSHSDTHPSAEVRCQLVANLAKAAGNAGMIGGQMIDMEAANHTFDSADVISLQAMKTGALFEFSCEGGAILADAHSADCERLRDYARDFGLLYQITDDLLDVVGTRAQTGKTVGKDQRQGKATLVSILGIDGARKEAARLAASAASTLDCYGDTAEVLRELPFFLLDRES